VYGLKIKNKNVTGSPAFDDQRLHPMSRDHRMFRRNSQAGRQVPAEPGRGSAGFRRLR